MCQACVVYLEYIGEQNRRTCLPFYSKGQDWQDRQQTVHTTRKVTQLIEGDRDCAQNNHIEQ